MSWRILTISRPSELLVEHFQLVCRAKDKEETRLTVPLEDIAALVLENRESTLSSWLLSECAERGIAVYTCDATHTPSGLLLPFMGHSRFSEVAWLQNEATLPFKKRCWQQLVQGKIRNQAEVLDRLGKTPPLSLNAMAERVSSGDTANLEGHAARVYWGTLFESFCRDDGDRRNSALNYGYAILRGALARAISGAGLLPCFGLHHANKLNAFNLADDLIEPYRPFVDLKVHGLFSGQDGRSMEKLSLFERQCLVSVLSENVLLGGKQEKILTATEKTVFSLVSAMRGKDPRELALPALAPAGASAPATSDGRD